MPNVPADPSVLNPMHDQPRVALLKPLVTSPLIEVGEFSYYDDPDDPTAFETRNVLHHYGPEKPIIGKFCALGEGVRFIMNGANHRMDGPSTFPFPIMGGSWGENFDLIANLPGRGDTSVGNDAWFGYRVTVMPGVQIGNGAIIASGFPPRRRRPRLRDRWRQSGQAHPPPLQRKRLTRRLALAWWNRPRQQITEHIRTVMSGSIDDLEPSHPSIGSGVDVRRVTGERRGPATSSRADSMNPPLVRKVENPLLFELSGQHRARPA